MRDLAPNESAALQKLKAALVRDFRLVELRLFGSKARGYSDKESDISEVASTPRPVRLRKATVGLDPGRGRLRRESQCLDIPLGSFII